MENLNTTILIEDALRDLKWELDKMLSSEPLTSAKVIELSRRIDVLILKYYAKGVY